MTQVLLVDDSASLRAIEWRVLRQSGLPFDAALEAGDGPTALALLSQHSDVELVLVDLDLAGLIEFIRAVRRDPTWARLPLVVVSSGRSLPAPALTAGAQASLSRPFTGADACAVLEPLLSTRARGE
jgi:two-component system chemotaxis response regulator CheY